MYGRVHGMTVLGVGGHPVTVEAFVGRGLPALTLTGLPGAAVADARDRIRPAVEHAGLEWPLRRVVVNLAPATCARRAPASIFRSPRVCWWPLGRSRGGRRRRRVLRELSLKEVLPTPGVLSVAIAAVQSGSPVVVVPKERRRSRARRGIHVVAVSSLEQVVMFLRGTWHTPRSRSMRARVAVAGCRSRRCAASAGAQGTRGGRRRRTQPVARRLARRGKTMLARRLASILPELPVTKRSKPHSCIRWRGCWRAAVCCGSAFRSPHHSISTVGCSGRLERVAPGEASLAHRGVLFLDELTEFDVTRSSRSVSRSRTGASS
jgi:magnesium chelatase family protein